MRFHEIACAAVSFLHIVKASNEQVPLSGDHQAKPQPYNVAIIGEYINRVYDTSPHTSITNGRPGAGAAGASSAYHLAQYAQAASIPINITMFERNSYIGGRTTTVNAYNDSDVPLELGASIFVEVNRILVEAAKTFNLSSSALSPASRRTSDIPGPALGVWDGKSLVATLQNEGGWWDTAKLLYKYGLAPIRTMNLMKATVGKFLQMYDEPIFPFASLTKAARDVGLSSVTASTGEQFLREHNIGSLFAREIVQASTRVNYAQNLETIHGLETMVCMAAEGAMAIDDGNWRIFDAMITAANATALLNTSVTALSQQRDGGYLLHSNDTTSKALTSEFDEVIIATPLQFANLSLVFPAHSISVPQARPYVHLHVTLFTAPHPLSPTFFGLSPNKPAPHAVLTTLPQSEHPPLDHQVGSPGFFSVSLLRTLANPRTGRTEYAYKIFSPSPVNATFLADLLSVSLDQEDELYERDVSWIYRKVWDSYPYETPRDSFDEIKLGEGLWYTSGIENFISTMETSALMGKNVGRLLVDGLVERTHGGRRV